MAAEARHGTGRLWELCGVWRARVVQGMGWPRAAAWECPGQGREQGEKGQSQRDWQLSPCPAAGRDEAPLPCAAPPARLCACGAIRGLNPHNLTTGTALPMPGCSSPPLPSPGEPFARPRLGSEENGADLPPRRGRGLGATGWHCCLAQTPSSSGAGGKAGKRWRGQSPGVALGTSHRAGPSVSDGGAAGRALRAGMALGPQPGHGP